MEASFKRESLYNFIKVLKWIYHFFRKVYGNLEYHSGTTSGNIFYIRDYITLTRKFQGKYLLRSLTLSQLSWLFIVLKTAVIFMIWYVFQMWVRLKANNIWCLHYQPYSYSNFNSVENGKPAVSSFYKSFTIRFPNCLKTAKIFYFLVSNRKHTTRRSFDKP